MADLSRVKSILAALALAFAATSASAADDPAPDARELLRSVRIAQSAQDWKLTGGIRVGSRKTPFRLTLEKGAIRYEFTDNGDTLTLRLGEKTSTLEETKGGKTARITAAKFGQPVHGTDLSYEDLAMRFLYWQNASVAGTDIISARRCWKVEVRPDSVNDSQYSRVMLWIGRDDGALMRAESYDGSGRMVRRFTVISFMKRSGCWLMRRMRIEHPDPRDKYPQPTYLEIEDAEK